MLSDNKLFIRQNFLIEFHYDICFPIKSHKINIQTSNRWCINELKHSQNSGSEVFFLHYFFTSMTLILFLSQLFGKIVDSALLWLVELFVSDLLLLNHSLLIKLLSQLLDIGLHRKQFLLHGQSLLLFLSFQILHAFLVIILSLVYLLKSTLGLCTLHLCKDVFGIVLKG